MLAKFDVASYLVRRLDTLNHCGRLFVNSDAEHFLSAVHHYNASAGISEINQELLFVSPKYFHMWWLKTSSKMRKQ